MNTPQKASKAITVAAVIGAIGFVALVVLAFRNSGRNAGSNGVWKLTLQTPIVSGGDAHHLIQESILNPEPVYWSSTEPVVMPTGVQFTDLKTGQTMFCPGQCLVEKVK